jgi:hypothetical protein
MLFIESTIKARRGYRKLGKAKNICMKMNNQDFFIDNSNHGERVTDGDFPSETKTFDAG